MGCGPCLAAVHGGAASPAGARARAETRTGIRLLRTPSPAWVSTASLRDPTDYAGNVTPAEGLRPGSTPSRRGPPGPGGPRPGDPPPGRAAPPPPPVPGP